MFENITQDELICSDFFNIRNCNDEHELIENKYTLLPLLNHSFIGLHLILIHTNAYDQHIYWNFTKTTSSRKTDSVYVQGIYRL